MGTPGIIHSLHECSEFTMFFSNSLIKLKIGLKMAYKKMAYKKTWKIGLKIGYDNLGSISLGGWIFRFYPVFLEFSEKMQNRGRDSIWELRVLSTYSCFIFTFALLKNMKLCSGQHCILGTVLWFLTVYLLRLLMVKELISTSMINVKNKGNHWNNQCLIMN